MIEKPTLMLVTGLPGTGKSTVARAACSKLEAAVLAWDWAMAALTPFRELQQVLGNMEPAEYRRVGWSLLWNLAVAQLRNGRSAVLDGAARDVEIAATRNLAEDNGARCLVVVTGCSDIAVHRDRVSGRKRDIPGWHELEWTHVAGFLGAYRRRATRTSTPQQVRPASRLPAYSPIPGPVRSSAEGLSE